jgi:hypothetical protein
VVDIPLSTLFGLAEIDAVGAGGGGGGGGGGGACFFLQAPRNMIAPRMNTRVVHFNFGYFTFSLPAKSCAHIPRTVKTDYAGQHSAITGDDISDKCFFMFTL